MKCPSRRIIDAGATQKSTKSKKKNELAIETDRPRPGLGAQHESATRKGTPLKHSKFYYFGRNWIKQKVAPG